MMISAYILHDIKKLEMKYRVTFKIIMGMVNQSSIPLLCETSVAEDEGALGTEPTPKAFLDGRLSLTERYFRQYGKVDL